VPRSNNSQSSTPPRTRSRGPARSTQRSASVDAAADRSTSSPQGDGASTTSATTAPTYDEIAEAAYHRYLKRGGGDGQDFNDWLEAERELRSRR